MFAGTFTVKLQLEGPVVSHSTALGAFGVDAAMAKTKVSKEIERHYLAGSLIKGLIGEAWQELGHDDWRQLHFGEDSQRGAYLPQRGKVHFEDFLDLKTDTGSTRTQYRIQIDESTGSVRQGQFQVIEAPWRSGQPVQFEAELRVLAESEAFAGEVRLRVERGLHWIMAAGAERTAGFGRLCGVTCGELKPSKGTKVELQDDRFGLDLTLTRPFCLATRRITENLFQSDRVISGGAIKGAIAEIASVDKSRYANLLAALHAIRFLHAFPATGGERTARRPLSLLHYRKGERDYVTDVADRGEAFLPGAGPPAFDIDWKEDVAKRINAQFGWQEPDTELRVRTQIEGEERRAKDENLFAYEMIVPHGFVWKGGVSLEAVEKKEAVKSELAELLSVGIFGIGKTKAWARAAMSPYPVAEYRAKNGKLILTLQTPALLCDPSRHLAQGGQSGVADADAMRAEYTDAWKELSGEALVLEDYFHRVSLAGGTYFHRRFQGGGDYRPYLLTEAGSVFVFCVREPAKARTLAEEWLGKGLNIPEGAQRFYGLSNDHPSLWWKKCPYVRENGFGEVSINGAIHEIGPVELRQKEESDV